MWTSFNVMSSIGQEDLAPEFKLTHHAVPKRFVIIVSVTKIARVLAPPPPPPTVLNLYGYHWSIV